ncbi:MAG TPA: hypothetical protein VK994_07555, partial [Bacteroidales bacterium]|nr:hypothetical protein [Bacteroidales bacterium]
MKQYIFILIIFLTSLNIAGQSAFQWANVCGHPYYSETKSLLDVDQDGNVIMAGNFIDTAIFGADHVISAGFTDIFMAKYDPSGELLWLTGDGGQDYEYLHGIASDEEGFFTCGTFYGTSNIGGNTFASFGSQDIFIARYDHDGNFIWARHIGSPKTDYANAVDADSYGNIVITGHYYDSIAFPDTTVYAMSASDIFLASFDADGNMIWVVTLGGSSSDQSHSISCDNSGNILVTGSFFNDITIADTMLSTTDPTGVFMAKFNNSGDLLFAQQLDGNGLIARSYASFDSEGNFFHAGNFTDQLSLGPYYFNAGPFNIDVYISKYNAMGDLLWADHGHSPGSDQLVAIHSGPLNDLYLTGHYLDTIFFGDIELKYTLCCGSSEIFIVRYTEDGTAIWG